MNEAILHRLERERSAVTIRDLARWLGVPRRAVEGAIQALRLDGAPICSGSDGVWLARSADEAEAEAQALRRRLVTQYKTVLAVRRTARQMRARLAGYVGQSELGL